jgi:hypothetical protein
MGNDDLGVIALSSSIAAIILFSEIVLNTLIKGEDAMTEPWNSVSAWPLLSVVLRVTWVSTSGGGKNIC